MTPVVKIPSSHRISKEYRVMARSIASGLLLLLSYPILLQFAFTVKTQDLYYPPLVVCSQGSNFTNNSTYKSNLDQLLTSFLSNPKLDHGFYYDRLGEDNNTVYSMALCRGDISPDTCKNSIRDSIKVLRESCPNQIKAIVWYKDCMVRYANHYIYRIKESNPALGRFRSVNISDSEINQFSAVLNGLLLNLTVATSLGDYHLKFAARNATVADRRGIFAMAQCTPDLTMAQCTECLNYVTDWIREYGVGIVSIQVYTPSCYLRYSDDFFYNPALATVPVSPALPAPPPVSVAYVPSAQVSSAARTTGVTNWYKALCFSCE